MNGDDEVELRIRLRAADLRTFIAFGLWKGLGGPEATLQSILAGAEAYMAAQGVPTDTPQVRAIIDAYTIRPAAPPPSPASPGEEIPEIRY